MINIFPIPPTDQSVYYLGQIFGFVGNILPVTSAPVILGVMFKSFNTIVLSAAALVVLYVTVMGVIKTAAEGEMLGKQWSSLWVPLRMVMGIAALVPTPSGYSAIQIVMMWIVLQGVGAANLIWDTVLKTTQVMGSPIATISIPSVGVSNDMQNLFQMLVCQATASQTADYTADPGSSNGNYFCRRGTPNSPGPNVGSPFCNKGANLLDITRDAIPSTIKDGDKTRAMLTYEIGPDGQCGAITYCDVAKSCADNSVEGQMYCKACTAQVASLQAIVTTLGAVAQQFASADLSYRQFYDNPGAKAPDWVESYCAANGLSGGKCCRATTPVEGEPPSACGIGENLSSGGSASNAPQNTVKELYWPFYLKPNVGGIDFINASSNLYVTSLQNAALESLQGQISNASPEGELARAREQGWIFAGAYYYFLAQKNNMNTQASMPILVVAPKNPNTGTSAFGNTRNNATVAGSLSSQVKSGSARNRYASTFPEEISGLSAISDGLSDTASDILNSFMNTLTGNKQGGLATNPIAQMQNLGKILLIVAQTLFALVMIVIPVLTIVGYLNVFVLGTGVDQGAGPAITSLVILFTPFFTILMGSLFTFGALLSVYLPLIPYVIFTMGAISWFILVIEAMVAAPLVAFGILLPAGGSEILGKAEGALMYAFGLFLRPSLMVFGMIAAMLLSIVVVTMINQGFLYVMGTVNSSPGLIEMLIFMGAYVGLVLAALNKCFALIHIVPDRVLTWIGGQAGGAGQEAGEGVSGIKGGVSATGGEAQKVGGRMKSDAEKGGQPISDAVRKKREEGKKIDLKDLDNKG